MTCWVLLVLGVMLVLGDQGEELIRHRRTLLGTLGPDNRLSPPTHIGKRKLNHVGHGGKKDAVEEIGGRRCVKKIMMVEETVFDQVETCDHSYDKKCVTSYITKYEPFQVEECGEQFRKSCFIKTEKKSVTENVEVCRAPIVKDCETEGEEMCRTVYESECWTKYHTHEVEEDVPVCKTVVEELCEDAEEGYLTQQKCDQWPREVCTVETRTVNKSSPHTGCDKTPKLMCTPAGCGIKEGPLECRNVSKAMLIDNPVEECQINPVRTCKFVTKLLPKLAAKETCIDVPKEICSKSRVKPRRVAKPVIKKWCFKPDNLTGSAVELEDEPEDCSQCGEGTTGVCDIEHTPYTQCKYCEDSVCVPGCLTELNCPQGYQCYDGECRAGPGKVLLNSVNIHTALCQGCSATEGVRLRLTGEVIGEFLGGVPCSTNTMDHKNSTDFSTGSIARFDGHLEGVEDEIEKLSMGACFKAPLNAVVGGGQVTWLGSGVWEPDSVCVDWLSSNMAYMCGVAKLEQNVWSLVNCRDLTPRQKCEEN